MLPASLRECQRRELRLTLIVRTLLAFQDALASRRSRQMPSFSCAARSEKLKRTALLSARCCCSAQLGATNTSFSAHSKDASATWLCPLPSRTTNTVLSVERYCAVRNPAAISCSAALIVGITEPPVRGLA